jgi:hypothetical protein
MEDDMRASSETIAQLAAALARAQLELVNPAKSLTATIERGRNGGALSYRYAPLSSGLDIVRRTLGKHELAVMQTTHVDRERGMVFLTTTLAHSSGDWICAHWPVCNTSDVGNPKLMGAALTYARRYSLFAMVGLAGEDDLDGPSLAVQGDTRTDQNPLAAPPTDEGHVAPVKSETESGHSAKPNPELNDQVADDQDTAKPCAEAGQALLPSLLRSARRTGRRGRPPASSFVLTANPIEDLSRIEDTETLVRWALEILPARNKLDESQRAALDRMFLARAEAIGSDPDLLMAFGGPVMSQLDGNGPPATAT